MEQQSKVANQSSNRNKKGNRTQIHRSRSNQTVLVNQPSQPESKNNDGHNLPNGMSPLWQELYVEISKKLENRS